MRVEIKKLLCKVDLFSIFGWCVQELVGDRRCVYQTGSNWAAVSLQWWWGTAGAFDWELFYSESPAVAPTVTKSHWCMSQPLSLLILSIFPTNSSSKSVQHRWSSVALWRGACAVPALIKAKHHTPPLTPPHWPFLWLCRRPTLLTLMLRVVPASNWPCSTPGAESGPWWQEEGPQWSTGT